MDLRQGGGCHRMRIKASEQRFDGFPPFGFDDSADERIGDGSDFVLEFAKFLDEFVRKHIVADAQHLPELDGGGTQLLEGKAYSFKAGFEQKFTALFLEQNALPFADQVADAEPVDDVLESVLEQDVQDGPVSPHAAQFPVQADDFHEGSVIESDSERIPRGLPRGMRANINIFFLTDRRFPAACGGELQLRQRMLAGAKRSILRVLLAGRVSGPCCAKLFLDL